MTKKESERLPTPTESAKLLLECLLKEKSLSDETKAIAELLAIQIDGPRRFKPAEPGENIKFPVDYWRSK